eukprot:Gb_29861 [translate_table: standard]
MHRVGGRSGVPSAGHPGQHGPQLMPWGGINPTRAEEGQAGEGAEGRGAMHPPTRIKLRVERRIAHAGAYLPHPDEENHKEQHAFGQTRTYIHTPSSGESDDRLNENPSPIHCSADRLKTSVGPSLATRPSFEFPSLVDRLLQSIRRADRAAESSSQAMRQ